MSDCTGCGTLLISGIGEDERCYDCLQKRVKSLARRCNILRRSMVDFRIESTRYMMLEAVALITLKETANHVERLTKALVPFAAGFPNTDRRDYLRAATALNGNPEHRCHECFSMCRCEAGRDDCNHCYIFESEK